MPNLKIKLIKMNKIINETLINSIKKKKYYNIFIKPKSENKKNIKKTDNKRKIKIIQALNISPLTLSFEPDEKNNSNSLFNNIGNFSKKINVFSAKLGNSYKYIRKGKIKFIKHKLSFSKASTNNTLESNKEKKTFKLIKGNLENDKDNLIVEHKKIDFSDPINYPLNKNKKPKLKNKSHMNLDSSQKYKTIFTKYNNNNNKNILEEPNYYLEKFSSKYNNNKIKKEEIKCIERNNLFGNEALNKAEFYKYDSIYKRNKYFKTESSTNTNNTTYNKSKNIKNYPNFLKNKKINLKLFLQKIQNNPINNIPIFTRFLNSKKEISLDTLPLTKFKNILSIKYSPINLNMFAKIPNRLVLIDNHGNELKGFKYKKNRLIKNPINKYNDIKQNITEIGVLRKQFLDIYNSNNITKNNSKKNLVSDNKKINIAKKNMYKTFYKNIQKGLSKEDKSNKKQIDFINNRNNHFLSEY